MSGRRVIVAGLVACLVGCTAPATTPTEPQPPTLEAPATSSDQPWRLPRLTLRATGEDDTVVQLFVSADCSGPELLRRPIDAFREGVELDTVSGKNVFTATALTRAGLRSRCSPVVSVEVRLPMRGLVTAPEVRGTPVLSPTKELSVTLTGFAQEGWTVRIWSKRDCEGLVLASGDASAFAEPGLSVPLQPNERLDVSLDATRGYELSRCGEVTTRLENDSTPPTFTAEFFPLPPHPFSENAIVVSDLELGVGVRMRSGRECGGADAREVGTAFCERDRCAWLLFPLFVPLPDIATFSLWATDAVGNESTCKTFEQQLTPRGAAATTPLWRPLGRSHLVFASPVGFEAQVFDSPDCRGGTGIFGNSTSFGGLNLRVATDLGNPTSALLANPPAGVEFPCVRIR